MDIDLKQLNLQEDTAGWDEFKIEGTPTIVYCKIKVQTSAKNLYRVLHYFCA